MAGRPFKWTTKYGRQQLREIVGYSVRWRRSVLDGAWTEFIWSPTDYDYAPYWRMVEDRTYDWLKRKPDWSRVYDEYSEAWLKRTNRAAWEVKELRSEVAELRRQVEAKTD